MFTIFAQIMTLEKLSLPLTSWPVLGLVMEGLMEAIV